MIIDSHHHFWNYNPLEYDWIDDKMSVIRRSFLPEELKNTISGAGVDGVVSVQARQCVEETDWLLKMAAENDFMKGVVGWLPIAQRDFPEILEKYASNPSLVALRHVIQGEPDDHFILGEKFNQGIAQLIHFNLIYDILIFERHLPQTIRFVDQHPNQVFVVDHIAKPQIAKNLISPWKENMKELAQRENVFCKISGMVTEAEFQNWTEAQLQPYFDGVLDAFTPNRLMFGSDWPVCLVGVDYQRWVSLIKQVIMHLSSDEQKAILGETAVKAYRLKV